MKLGKGGRDKSDSAIRQSKGTTGSHSGWDDYHAFNAD